MAKTWIDAEGNERPFVKGLERCRFLDQQATDANSHHATIRKLGSDMVQHAYKAGLALLNAKTVLGHRTKWSKWRNANFDGSKETSCAYMRVALNWDTPSIVDLRDSGEVLTLALVLSELRTSSKQTNLNERFNNVRDQIIDRLKELSSDEMLFLQKFSVSNCWSAFVENLQGDMCMVWGEDTDDQPLRYRRPMRVKSRATGSMCKV